MGAKTGYKTHMLKDNKKQEYPKSKSTNKIKKRCAPVLI